MHDEPMMEENGERAAAEIFEARVGRALEAKPEVSVPADFAARVAGRVSASQTNRLRRTALLQGKIRQTHYGYAAMLVCMGVLSVAMLVFAPRAVRSSTLWLEWTLCAQFVLLTLWFGLRRNRLR